MYSRINTTRPNKITKLSCVNRKGSKKDTLTPFEAVNLNHCRSEVTMGGIKEDKEQEKCHSEIKEDGPFVLRMKVFVK